jgi:ligand-binding sensor domain-containing protein
MKKIIIMALMAVAILPTHAENAVTGDNITKSEKNDTVRIRYIHRLTEDDARIFESNLQKTVIYVNDQVTTHLIMPENIKLVDISTDKLVGNQCADNIVRLKPKSTLMDNELAGTVTVIGERHIAQFTVYYTKAPKRAHSVYTVGQDDIRDYTNP